MSEKKVKFKYKVGTMIEIPRAALVADKIAKYAEFFSFERMSYTDDIRNFQRRHTHLSFRNTGKRNKKSIRLNQLMIQKVSVC